MTSCFARLATYRELLWLLALSELKARHRHTALGMVWALVQPISMMLVFTVVFSVFVNIQIQEGPYALFAYIGLLSWLFFANSLSAGAASIVSQMNLITKASFPREVIPLSKLLTTGFDFLIGLACLALLLIWYQVPARPAWLAIPGILVIHLMLTAGFVLLSSALYVLRRDVGSLLPLLLQVWMFLSPVVYPVTLIPDQYRTFYLLNPMAAIIEAYRSVILGGTLPAATIMAPVCLIAFATLVAGYGYFKSVESQFADVM